MTCIQGHLSNAGIALGLRDTVVRGIKKQMLSTLILPTVWLKKQILINEIHKCVTNYVCDKYQERKILVALSMHVKK